MGLEATGHVETLHPALKTLTFAHRRQIHQIAWLQKLSAQNLASHQTIKFGGIGKTELLIMIKASSARWPYCGPFQRDLRTFAFFSRKPI